MRISLKHTLTQSFILLMMVVVSLPCATKREIKSVFASPVTSSNTEFQKVKASCITYIQADLQSRQSGKARSIIPFLKLNRSVDHHVEFLSLIIAFRQFSHYLYSPVRLHQLYEQYLI